jgi:alkylated DNA repair dioxygenase AlkB
MLFPESLKVPTLEGGKLRLWQLPQQKADRWLTDLLADGAVAWEQPELILYGRKVLTPRLTAWYGEPGTAYRYSGRTFEPLPLTPLLRDIQQQVEQLTGCTFNSVLLNRYRQGTDSMGWHADDEPELGPAPEIASLSLGAARNFSLKPKPKTALAEQDPKLRHKLLLPHGSLLLMLSPMQANWQHAVAKTKQVVGERLNLTFRFIQH